jgi:F-type H+-transporting ATPase subunit c
MSLMPMIGEAFIGNTGLALLGASLGAGFITYGAAKGIGSLATASVESQARQPEVGGRVFTTMIIAAALIEGFTFFALIVCMMIGGQLVEAIKAGAETVAH